MRSYVWNIMLYWYYVEIKAPWGMLLKENNPWRYGVIILL